MTDSFVIDLGWLTRDHGTAAENATFGDVRIASGDVVFTRLYDELAKTERDTARLSVLHLARWLVANWWRLCWEPRRQGPDWRMSHCLPAAGGGFLWPELEFASDGEFVSLASRVSRQSKGAAVRYLGSQRAEVSRSRFESTVGSLVSTVLSRLVALDCKDAELDEAWKAVSNERSDAAERNFRRKEAVLGLDPDEVDHAALQRLFSSGDWLGPGTLPEVLAYSSSADALEGTFQLLARWRDISTAAKIDVSEVRHASLSLEMGIPAWQRGESLARQLRAARGFGDRPIQNELERFVGTKLSSLHSNENSDLGAAFRHGDDEDSLTPILRRGRETTKRFQLARILGDIAAYRSQDRVVAVTDAGTARQKVQRAFASEFLLPTSVLRQRLHLPEPSATEIEEIADEYGVSPLNVQSKLVNRELVSRDYFGFGEWAA